MIRVVVAEDHPLIREGIKKIVRNQKDILIAGEADNIHDACELINEIAPDVIVLDLTLHNTEGLTGLHHIHMRYPTLPILVLSMHPEEVFAVKAFSCGASAYIHKSSAADELIAGIRRLKDGGKYITSKVAELLAAELCERKEDSGSSKLSDREIAVVRLLGEGLHIKQIAAVLGVTVSTVNTYRKRIFKKTNLNSNAALIRFAIQNRLVH